MTCYRVMSLMAAASMLACGGAARAQALKLAPYRVDAAEVALLPIKAVAASRPAPDLANPLDPLAPTAIQIRSVESAVFAKTAVEHRFSRRQDITGSLGFLCGLQPGHTESGGAGAYGTDPHGRFVGAKLSFAFR